MKNKKVLITGGEGFVGIHLTHYLLENSNYDLFCTFHFEHNNRVIDNRVTYIQLDITDEGDVLDVLGAIEPDYIYHLAGISFVPASFENPSLTYSTNLLGTLNIYEAIRKLKISPSILFVSTSEVYGKIFPEEIPIEENRILKPQNPYAVSKAAGEMLSYQYYKNYGLDIKIARPFNHIGINQSSNFVVASFAEQIISAIEKNSEVIKVGNLAAIRDFLDVKDVLRAYKLLIESNFSGEVYNICSGNGTQIEKILNKLIQISGKDIKMEFDPMRMRPSDNPIIKGDYKKIKKHLGWQPNISIEETLRNIFDSFLKES